MMHTEAEFVQAIQANPDANTLRLVYADWLDENATTDQQRARAEWIRVSCFVMGKRAQQPTGKRTRVKGERDWMMNNAYRLWPNLYSLQTPWSQRSVSKLLQTGRVTLSLSIAYPLREGNGERILYSRVSIQAERGVTTEIAFDFNRAARIAPLAAADEPFAGLRLSTLPARCFTFRSAWVYLHRKPFEDRGLGSVWDLIAGGNYTLIEEHEKAWEFTQPNGVFNTKHLEPRINAALTSWARIKACKDGER